MRIHSHDPLRPVRASIVAAALFAVATTGEPAQTTTVASRSPIRYVFLIVLENRNWSQVKGNPTLPYINRALLPVAAHAERYFNPPHLHPSEPNYLWLVAGTNFGIDDNQLPYLHHQSTHRHLMRLLANAGISWKSYQEDIPGNTCPLDLVGLYSPIHNPMVYFDDITGRNNPRSSYCMAHIRPFAELARDLQRNTVPRFSLVGANKCHNGHDCSERVADRWLSRTVPGILASRAFRSGGALFITWDEGSHWSDGPIGMIVLSQYAKRGYHNYVRYTHSSWLRTVQEIFGVTPLLGGAAYARDLSGLFTRLR